MHIQKDVPRAHLILYSKWTDDLPERAETIKTLEQTLLPIGSVVSHAGEGIMAKFLSVKAIIIKWTCLKPKTSSQPRNI